MSLVVTSPAISSGTSASPDGAPVHEGPPRSPVPWIVAWAIYCLLALGYWGYQSAWLSTLCVTVR